MASEKLAQLKWELAVATTEYNAKLGEMDAVVQRTLWKAAQDAAAKAFDYHERADDLNARSSKTPELVIEAAFAEIGAGVFRDLSHDLMRLTDNVPSFVQQCGLKT
jgi:hypothetical protein